MGKAYDYLASGFMNNREYNCAERMLKAISVAYGLELSDRSIKLAAGFGGGMSMEYTCGAISGALMGLSDIFVEKYAHESDMIHNLSIELFDSVKQKLDATDCYTLKKNYRNEQEKCARIIYAVAKAVDEIIEKYGCNNCD